MALDLHSSFPIAKISGPDRHIIGGTAFYIGAGVFLTAAHCLQGYEAGNHVILVAAGDEVGFSHISVVEKFDGCDVAIFRIDLKDDSLFTVRPWLPRAGLLGGNVVATGYPCLTLGNGEELYSRTISSTIASRHPYRQLKANPVIYEIGGYMPVGMSGSPLEYIPPSAEIAKIGHLHEHFPICGIVIGNVSLGTELFRSEESVKVNGNEKVEVHVKEEVAHFGIAVSSEHILSLVSLTILKGEDLKTFIAAHPPRRSNRK
jgi:hypothetical protein